MNYSKNCSHCNKNLDGSMFYSNKVAKDGLTKVCKECTLARNKLSPREKNLARNERLSEKHLTEKQCNKCEETKSINEFIRNKAAVSFRYASRCRSCQKEDRKVAALIHQAKKRDLTAYEVQKGSPLSNKKKEQEPPVIQDFLTIQESPIIQESPTIKKSHKSSDSLNSVTFSSHDLDMSKQSRECKDCNQIKLVESFAKKGKNIHGDIKYFNICKDCKNLKQKEWRKNNSEAVKKQVDKYKNSEKGKKTIQLYNQKLLKNYVKVKKEKKEPTEYQNLVSKLRKRLRTRFNRSSRSWHAHSDVFLDSSLDEMIGIDWHELPRFLEEKLQKKLTVNGLSEYHIDHILPLSRALNHSEYKERIHFSNLELIPSEENIEKSNNYKYESFLFNSEREKHFYKTKKWVEKMNENSSGKIYSHHDSPLMYPYIVGFLVSMDVENCLKAETFKNKQDVKNEVFFGYDYSKDAFIKRNKNWKKEQWYESFTFFVDNPEKYKKRRDILLKSDTVNDDILDKWREGNFLYPL